MTCSKKCKRYMNQPFIPPITVQTFIGIGNSSEAYSMRSCSSSRPSPVENVHTSSSHENNKHTERSQYFSKLPLSLDPNIGLTGHLPPLNITYKANMSQPWNIAPYFLDILEQSSLNYEEDCILLFGGLNPTEPDDFVLGCSIFEFQIISKTWRYYGCMMEPRCYHATASTQSFIYVTGGYSHLQRREGEMSAVPYTDRLDISTTLWERCAPMNVPRAAHAMVAVGENLFVFGGRDSSGRVLASVEAYYPLVDAWAIISLLPRPSMGLSAVLVEDKVWIGGGITTQGSAEQHECIMKDVYCFSLSSGRWSSETFLPESRSFSQFVVSKDSIYVIGGSYLKKGSANNTLTSCNSVWQLCLRSKPRAWKVAGSLLYPTHASSAALYGDKILVFGGIQSGKSVADAVQVFDTITGKSVKVSSLPSAITGLSTVFLPKKISIPKKIKHFSHSNEYVPEERAQKASIRSGKNLACHEQSSTRNISDKATRQNITRDRTNTPHEGNAENFASYESTSGKQAIEKNENHSQNVRTPAESNSHPINISKYDQLNNNQQLQNSDIDNQSRRRFQEHSSEENDKHYFEQERSHKKCSGDLNDWEEVYSTNANISNSTHSTKESRFFKNNQASEAQHSNTGNKVSNYSKKTMDDNEIVSKFYQTQYEEESNRPKLSESNEILKITQCHDYKYLSSEDMIQKESENENAYSHHGTQSNVSKHPSNETSINKQFMDENDRRHRETQSNTHKHPSIEEAISKQFENKNAYKYQKTKNNASKTQSREERISDKFEDENAYRHQGTQSNVSMHPSKETAINKQFMDVNGYRYRETQSNIHKQPSMESTISKQFVDENANKYRETKTNAFKTQSKEERISNKLEEENAYQDTQSNISVHPSKETAINKQFIDVNGYRHRETQSNIHTHPSMESNISKQFVDENASKYRGTKSNASKIQSRENTISDTFQNENGYKLQETQSYVSKYPSNETGISENTEEGDAFRHQVSQPNVSKYQSREEIISDTFENENGYKLQETQSNVSKYPSKEKGMSENTEEGNAFRHQVSQPNVSKYQSREEVISDQFKDANGYKLQEAQSCVSKYPSKEKGMSENTKEGNAFRHQVSQPNVSKYQSREEIISDTFENENGYKLQETQSNVSKYPSKETGVSENTEERNAFRPQVSEPNVSKYQSREEVISNQFKDANDYRHKQTYSNVPKYQPKDGDISETVEERTAYRVTEMYLPGLPAPYTHSHDSWSRRGQYVSTLEIPINGGEMHTTIDLESEFPVKSKMVLENGKWKLLETYIADNFSNNQEYQHFKLYSPPPKWKERKSSTSSNSSNS